MYLPIRLHIIPCRSQ